MITQVYCTAFKHDKATTNLLFLHGANGNELKAPVI